MRDRQYLPGIHSRGFHQRNRQTVDLIEGFNGKDVSFLYLDRDHQNIGRTEHAGVFFVQLQVRMAGRIEIQKVHLDRSMKKPDATGFCG